MVHSPDLVKRYPESAHACQKLLALCDGEEDEQSTPIHQALIFHPDDRRLTAIREAIRTHPECLNVLDGVGLTPLHWATGLKDVAAARIILAMGADVNSRGYSGKTPLFTSVSRARSESDDVIRLLLESGADVNAISDFGTSPLMASAMDGTIHSNFMAILLANGADPHRVSLGFGYSALHTLYGEFSDSDEAEESTCKLDLLLGAGANINQRDALGRCPLLLAAQGDDFRFITLLLERGADVSLRDAEGKGLLHYVALDAAWQAMEAIRLHHSDSSDEEYYLGHNLRDRSGATPADYFKERVDAMEQAIKPNGLLELSRSFTAVSQKDIEEWVQLMEDVQSCSRHVHTHGME